MAVMLWIILFSVVTVFSLGMLDTSPPSITKDPAPTRGYDILIVDKQIPLRLKCDALGRPSPTYRWLKYDLNGANPVELDKDDPRITVDDGDLTIANTEAQQQQEVIEGENPFLIDREDEGIYQCIAENMYGSAFSRKVKARLAYIDAYSWVEPVYEEANVGAKVVLDCNPPDGVPNPRLSMYWSWGLPGEPIKNPIVHNERVILDGNGNLVFANVQPQDDRNYLCIAPNHFLREVRNSPIIAIAVDSNNPAPERGPSFVYKPPIAQEVLRTKKIEIICAAEGNPTPEITWSWEDDLNIEVGRIEFGNGNTKMTVWDVTFDDAGEYTCTATNPKSSTSATTTITVKSAPYWHPAPPEDRTIDPQESIVITCQAGGSPAPAITWLINGKQESEIEPNPRRTIESGQARGQISIRAAETSDTAVFQCVANNKYGEEITNVYLYVLAIPAEIQTRPNAYYELTEGSDVELACKPFGAPHPKVAWSFNGTEIRGEGGKYSISTGGSNEGMLTVAEVTLADKGVYTCNVSNAYGWDVATPRVIVRMQTSITEGPGYNEVEEGDSVILSCKIQSDPELEWTVEWIMNEGETDERIIDPEVESGRYRLGRDASLTIIMAKKMDGGKYTCKAITKLSQASETGTLTILSVPDKPFNVEVVGSNHLEANLTWTPGSNGNSEILSYKIEAKTEFSDLGWSEMKTVSAASTTATLSLKAYNTYNFRVKASNAVGRSQPSELSGNHTTPAERPIVNPSDVRGSGPDHRLMVVTWKKIHQSDYAGPDFKYILRYKVKHTIDWHEIPVTPDEDLRVEVRDDEVDSQQYDIQVITENSQGRSQMEPDTVTGMSGERMQTSITEGPGYNEVEEGDSVILSCKIQSDPELEWTVEWIMNEGETDERIIDPEVESGRYRLGRDASLTIIMAKKMDGGKYTCKAITKLSQASETGTLTILSVPDKPFNVEVVGSNHLEANLTWTPGSNGNSEILSYKIEAKTEFSDLGWSEMKTVSAASTTATLSLKAYNTYNFRVKASNAVGRSQPSELSGNHTTPAERPIVNPSDVRGSGPDHRLMVVTWKKIHQSDYAGPDFKYILRYKVKHTIDWHEIPVTPDEDLRVEVRDDEVDSQQYDIQVITENSQGRSQMEPDTVTGMSGERIPTAAPGDVNVDVIDSSSVRVSWAPVPPEFINGIVLGYKIYTTTIAANSEEIHNCPESPCVVDGLQASRDYSLQVAVYNGAGEGPKSFPIIFDTKQGLIADSGSYSYPYGVIIGLPVGIICVIFIVVLIIIIYKRSMSNIKRQDNDNSTRKRRVHKSAGSKDLAVTYQNASAVINASGTYMDLDKTTQSESMYEGIPNPETLKSTDGYLSLDVKSLSKLDTEYQTLNNTMDQDSVYQEIPENVEEPPEYEYEDNLNVFNASATCSKNE